MNLFELIRRNVQCIRLDSSDERTTIPHTAESGKFDNDSQHTELASQNMSNASGSDSVPGSAPIELDNNIQRIVCRGIQSTSSISMRRIDVGQKEGFPGRANLKITRGIRGNLHTISVDRSDERLHHKLDLWVRLL